MKRKDSDWALMKYKVAALKKQAGAMRSVQKTMRENVALSEEIQGYQFLKECKNVALVDISEYTKPGLNTEKVKR